MFLDYNTPAQVAPVNQTFDLTYLAAFDRSLPARPGPLPVTLSREQIREMVREVLG